MGTQRLHIPKKPVVKIQKRGEMTITLLFLAAYKVKKDTLCVKPIARKMKKAEEKTFKGFFKMIIRKNSDETLKSELFI